MTVERVIDRLVGLINPDNAEEENQALEEAVKVLKRYNLLMQVKAKPVKQRIKIQYEGEELKKQLADIQPAIISSSNISLAPEELLEMVGQPVWTVGVSFTDDGKWEMWDIVEDIDKDGITFGYSTESREWWNYNLRDAQGNLMGCAWTCYRQPPKEVQQVQRKRRNYLLRRGAVPV